MKELLEMVFILDKSGSMHGLEQDTIGGFNSVVDARKKDGSEGFVTTVLFSDENTVLHDRVPLSTISPLTEREYSTGGCTALFDAVGETLDHISMVRKYLRPEDVPAKTVVVIITDGMENASRRFTGDGVKRLIEQKKESGWEFLFLGANMDAVTAAASIGIDAPHSVKYKSDRKGTKKAYRAVGKAMDCMCAGVALEESDWKREVEEDVASRN